MSASGGSFLCVRARPVPPGHGGSLWSPHNFAWRSERRPASRTFAGPNESNQSKGPNTIRVERFGKKVRPATCSSAGRTARPRRRASALALLPGRAMCSIRVAVRRPNLRCEASRPERVQALCFGDFHLGQQMKVTGQPGPDPARCRHGKAIPSVRTTRT